VGPVVARHVCRLISHAEKRSDVDRCWEAAITWPSLKGDSSQQTEGKIRDCRTAGSASPRDSAEEALTSRGGQGRGSVSKKDHYVVAGAEGGLELKKAQELGITVLDEPVFGNCEK